VGLLLVEEVADCLPLLQGERLTNCRRNLRFQPRLLLLPVEGRFLDGEACLWECEDEEVPLRGKCSMIILRMLLLTSRKGISPRPRPNLLLLRLEVAEEECQLGREDGAVLLRGKCLMIILRMLLPISRKRLKLPFLLAVVEEEWQWECEDEAVHLRGRCLMIIPTMLLPISKGPKLHPLRLAVAEEGCQ